MTMPRKKVLGGFFVCAAALALLIWYGVKQPEPGQWQSRPLYGSSLCDRQLGSPFAVQLVATRDSGWDGAAASFYAAFDVPWASLENCSLTKAASIGGYDLYQVQGTVTITGDPGEAESFHLRELTVNGQTISGVENLVFEVEREGNDRFASLELRSCAAGALGLGLKDYHAFFLNTSDEPLTITAVEAAQDSAAIGAVVQDGEVLDLQDGPVEVAPGQEVEVQLIFEQTEQEELTSYFAAPVVWYREDGQERSVQLQTYQSGTTLSDQDIQQLGDLLFRDRA